MKALFSTFKKSLYEPALYRTIADAPLKDAFRYYAKFGFVLSVVATVLFSILLIPHGVRFIQERAPELVREYYPAELLLTISQGAVSINVAEPYIAKPKGDMQSMLKENGFENMLVIDTKNVFDKKKFEEYNTFALLTKNELVTKSNQGQITIQDIPSALNATLDQKTLLAWVEHVRSALVYIVPLGILATFVTLFLSYVVYLIPLLLFALAPFLIAKMRNIPLSYGGAYRISLYAVIPGIVLKSFLSILGIFFVPAYLTFLVFLLIVTLNLRKVEQPKLFEN